MRSLFLLLPFAAAATLTACAATPTPPVDDGTGTPVAQGECVPEKAKALEGQSGLTDDKVKALTGASTVRRAGPDGMLTQDFRVERVTLIVDPQSQKIVRASCG